MKKTKLESFIRSIDKAKSLLTDEQAAQAIGLYPEWRIDASYISGEKVTYSGKLYTVLQAHTAQEGWTPTAAPSLFAPVLAGQGGTDVGEWQQPDSTNAYNTGDRCYYQGVLYESTIDGNVWSPADYPAGWRVVS